jgi:2-oxoglutarate dehydrogenase E1 component
MSDINLFHGPNAGYMLELYERFLQDPDSVDAETRAFFTAYPPQPQRPSAAARTEIDATTQTPTAAPLDVALAAARLARMIRQRGHLGADIDPLGIAPEHNPGLDIASHGLTEQTLALLPSRVVGGPLAETSANARESIARLREVYSGSIGYEDEHVQDPKERYWLREVAESRRFFQDIDLDKKRDLLQRLIEVDAFEQFIHQTYQGDKRFSIEGTDALVPILDEIIRDAATSGAKEVVMGMAHRGRLNVLAHVLGKPYANIFQEFRNNKGETASVSGGNSQGWLGDVKYHLGYQRAFKETGVAAMPITLVPNPSHLEFVNAVVEGHARAAQEQCELPGEPTQNTRDALPILIHGDAAFPGQGIVAETLNLSNLPGYRTGGTIHIIANNQIGFTTLPGDSRSTLYASDLAKGFEIPIVHVNADDPVACIAVARMAYAYRQEFGKDFLIDLIGYRRYGHNEGDNPRTTQPLMYAVIDAHKRPWQIWAEALQEEGAVTPEEVLTMAASVKARLRVANETKPAENGRDAVGTHDRVPQYGRPQTAVPAETLIELNAAMLKRPEGFHPNPDSERRFWAPRTAALTQPGGIGWAHAEALAYAAILAEGIPIRLSGQDSERGTFDQRRLVLYDVENGTRYVPLQHLRQVRAPFAVYNSPLSENAVLGFEYGYSIHAPDVLVLWEGQFGDFANGAQVIIDQFIAAGNAKWRQTPSLVLLLPHGYEGQGPEHSSARIERFLQLAASDNLRIVNCTTAAQYFHVLRRQAALLKTDPRPLVIFTPKSLLRDPHASSSLADLTQGTFQTVIDDAEARERAGRITRLVLCTGKVYINLTHPTPTTMPAVVEARAKSDIERIAAVRVEELYPFPKEELRELIASYPNLREIVWLQEEPRNMGAWSFVDPRLRELLDQMDWGGDFYYVGRAESASPAEGSVPRHHAEQSRILTMALEAAPPPPPPMRLSEPASATK